MVLISSSPLEQNANLFFSLRAAAVGAARMATIDAEGIQDRAYRLTYNDSQNRTDQFAQVPLKDS
jgi:hypothetical protein